MSTYKTEGIILRRTNFGEANLLLHIYTRDLGKVEAVARSARKARGKLKGHLEPFLYCDFLIVHGRKMDTIANSFILDNFLDLRSNLESILAASAVAEISDKMILPGYRDERVFQLILESLRFMDERLLEERKSLWLSALFFEMNILVLSGFSPQIDKCVFCGGKLREGNNYFSFSLGGVLDEDCRKKCPDAISVDDDVIRLIKFLQINPKENEDYAEMLDGKLAEIKKLNVKGEVLAKSIFLLKKFIEFNLDQKINSLDVLCDFARGKI
jgi:DNA repair protein RecO (recombination protein O)